jgi:Arc/MetJ-type ribon-helix-helix transcriptional regulator
MDTTLMLDALALDELVAYSRFESRSAYVNSLLQREIEQLALRRDAEVAEQGQAHRRKGVQLHLHLADA